MANSEQLEREAEQTRAQLAQRLDELRERITPGQLVDQAFDYAKDSGGGKFVRNLGNQVTANPLPVALVGAGIAWLMLSNGRASSGRAYSSATREQAIDRARRAAVKAAEQASRTSQSAGERIGAWTSDASAGLDDTNRQASEMGESRTAADAAEYATAKAGETASALGESASAAYESATSAAAQAYDRLSDSATRTTSNLTGSASSFGQRTADATKNLLQFCKSQPIVLAGIGMALGAIVGALIPPTETEARLMGQSSDELKVQARDLAEEQGDKLESAAQTGLDQAQAQFQQGGSQSNAETGIPAETSLVPEAEQHSEYQAFNEDVEQRR